MKIEKQLLNNGLETVLVHSQGATAASIQIWFRAGSALEDKLNQGIAHFLEHMFFKGSQTRPGHLIAEEVENFGGEINAFTSFDYTCYYINCPFTHILKATEILLDMVSNPLFGENELVPERGVVFEEYRRSLDNPSQFHFKEIQKNFFLKGYKHQILGTEKTIRSFTREQLVSFREQFYNLSNSMLVIAGDISNKEQLTSIINNYSLPRGNQSQFDEFKLKKNTSTYFHHKDVRQTTINITIQSLGYDHDNVAWEDLAINCIAHGESSHLFHNLVSESSLASSVSGSTMYFNNGGAHFIRITCPSENVEKIFSKMVQILSSLRTSGFKDFEANKIKNQYIASKIYERESIESFSFGLGHGFAQNGDIHSEDNFITKIKNSTSSEVNEGLKSILLKDWHITVQTPKNTDNASLKLKVERIINRFKDDIKNKKTLSTPKYKKIQSTFDPSAQEIILKNGIKLLYRKNTMTPTFVFHAYLKGGLSNENIENSGIHGLISRCITYGNSKISYDELKEELEFKSSYLSGFSGKNAYGMTMHGQTEHFNRLSEIFLTTLFEPNFSSKYFNLEKKLVLRSIENAKEDPVKQIFKRFQKIVFNKHPYSLDQIGNESTIKKIKITDLEKLHSNNLNKSQIVFTYCGDLESDRVVSLIEAFLKNSKPRIPSKTKQHTFEKFSSLNIKIDFNREQSHLFIGKRSHSLQHKDDNFLNLFTSYLSGQSSVLFTEIRDKQGLCYTIQPVHHSALEGGYWGIYMASGPEKLDKGIESIRKILSKFSTHGISKKEFELVKKMIEGQNLMANQTNDDFANFYSIPSLHELGIDYQHKKNSEIKDIKLDEFNIFLKKFLSADWITISTGPKI